MSADDKWLYQFQGAPYGEKFKQRLTRPHGRDLCEHLESSVGRILQHDEKAAVTLQFLKPLILERPARYFGQPDCSVIIEPN